jgi:hypothetical protein
MGPFDSASEFQAADFALLEQFELDHYGTSVLNVVSCNTIVTYEEFPYPFIFRWMKLLFLG